MSIKESQNESCYGPEVFIWQIMALKGISKRSCFVQNRLGPKPENAPKMTVFLGLDDLFITTSHNYMTDPDITFPLNYKGFIFNVSVKVRPGFNIFIDKLKDIAEIIIHTASDKEFVDKVLNIMDPEITWSKNRLYRDDCILVQGNFIKDISIYNRDLSKTICRSKENSIYFNAYQLDNCVTIKPWTGDMMDNELDKLYKHIVVMNKMDDIRPYIKRVYKIKKRIIDAVQLWRDEGRKTLM